MEESDSDPSREGFSTPEPVYPGHELTRQQRSVEVHPWQVEEADGNPRLLVIIRERDELGAEIIELGGTENAPPEIVQNWHDVCDEVINFKVRKIEEAKAEEETAEEPTIDS